MYELLPPLHLPPLSFQCCQQHWGRGWRLLFSLCLRLRYTWRFHLDWRGEPAGLRVSSCSLEQKAWPTPSLSPAPSLRGRDSQCVHCWRLLLTVVSYCGTSFGCRWSETWQLSIRLLSPHPHLREAREGGKKQWIKSCLGKERACKAHMQMCLIPGWEPSIGFTIAVLLQLCFSFSFCWACLSWKHLAANPLPAGPRPICIRVWWYLWSQWLHRRLYLILSLFGFFREWTIRTSCKALE